MSHSTVAVLGLPAVAGAIGGPPVTLAFLVGAIGGLTLGFLDQEGMRRGRGEAPGHTIGVVLALAAASSYAGSRLAGSWRLT